MEWNGCICYVVIKSSPSALGVLPVYEEDDTVQSSPCSNNGRRVRRQDPSVWGNWHWWMANVTVLKKEVFSSKFRVEFGWFFFLIWLYRFQIVFIQTIDAGLKKKKKKWIAKVDRQCQCDKLRKIYAMR